MKPNQHTRAAAVIATTLALSACGGGGSSTTAPSTPTAPPASGTFSWVLKAQGPTDSVTLKPSNYGLSLLHPGTPGTEWVIEPAGPLVSDAKLVATGTIDAAGLRASALKPYALVYIVGGDVRRVPMEANGTAPISRVQRAVVSSACAFVIDAIDYSAPENSRFIVSTAGTDGKCGTADDGRAEVKLGTTGGLSLTTINGAAPLGVFRDTTTLAPRGWIYPKSVWYWDTGSGSTVPIRTPAQPAFTELIASTYRGALLDDGVQLSLVDFGTGSLPVPYPLDAATTGGGGWCNIGFDAGNHYVYRNTVGSVSLACGAKPTAATTWTMLKITRTAPAATVLASGAGAVSVASLGSTLLYATVIGTADNRLLAISKSGALLGSEITPSTTLTTVQTSANDVHLLWRVTNLGTAAITYTIEMIDETGAVLYSTSTGGWPLVPAEASIMNFNASESRTRFIFVDGFTYSKAFSNARVLGFDTASKATPPTTFGTLPGSADYGTDFVYANAMSGLGTFMTGMVARSSGGSIQATGAKVFSFDATVAGSLQFATVAQ